MNQSSIAVCSSVMLTTVAACAGTLDPELSTGSCELVQVFIEDFDTLSVSPNRIGPARWTAHTPWWGDFGDAKFMDPGPNGPFSIDNGVLSITAARDNKGQWRSGLLAAADRRGRGYGTRYGYFEARMKFPPGPGTWPAFWLMPLEPIGSIDFSIEIDIVEYYGHRDDAFSTVVHVYDKVRNERMSSEFFRTNVPRGSLLSDFNTFGVDISPDFLVFFLNGEEIGRQETPSELEYRMYPLVNLALGSGWPIDKTPDPSIMLVDYVHVYARSDSTDCVPGLPE